MVAEPEFDPSEIAQRGLVQLSALFERAFDQAGEVDRTEQTRSVRRQHLLAAGIGGADLFAIGEIVQRIDTVDEDHARLGRIVGRTHEPLPQRSSADGANDLAIEPKRPFRVGR